MKNSIKLLVLMPSVLCILAGCSTETVHVSRPKEIITNAYEDDMICKVCYQYDKKGNVTSEDYLFLNNETKEYEYSAGVEYVFNSNNDAVQMTSFKGDEKGRKTPFTKIIVTFDGTKRTKSETFSFDENGELKLKNYSQDIKYDSLNRMLEYSSYSVNATTGEATKTGEVKYEYQGNFEQAVKITQKTFIGEDTTEMVSTYTLDDQGRVLTSLGVSDDIGQFETFLYDENGEVTNNTAYTYDVATGQYFLEASVDYTYVNKHYVSRARYTYYNEQSAIRRLISEEREYDKKMNTLSMKVYDISYSSTERVLLEENTYFY